MNGYVSNTVPAVPVIRPPVSITITCISSFEPPEAVACEDVPGVDVKYDLYVQLLNNVVFAESNTSTLIELPKAPA